MSKRLLYQYPLCPFCRKVRLVLFEKGLEYETVLEKPWLRRAGFLALNPAGEVPVLVEEGGDRVLSGHSAICEFLDEIKTQPSLFGDEPYMRAEARRLAGWFDVKFFNEVHQYIMEEIVYKRLTGRGEPDSRVIRAGRTNLLSHLKYITWLVERRNFLAGRSISLADFSAAAQLSVLDYLGEVPWEKYPEAKAWYAIVKSRPSFQPILKERILEISPPSYYANLDF